MAGIGAFALGHILYVVGFVSLFDPGRPDLLFWTVTGGLIALGASTELWLSAHTGPLRPLVRIYVGLILGMGICAALPGLPREFLLTGALSFVASDLILSTLIFLGWTARWASYAVWGLYWLAQALIMAGFWQVAAA